MPFHIVPKNGKYKVVGDFKGQPGHVYGTHDSHDGARRQQKALYANVPDAGTKAAERLETGFVNGDTQLVVIKLEDLQQIAVKHAALSALPHQDRVADSLADPEVQGQIAYHGLGSGKTFTSINAAKKLNTPIVAVVPAPLRNNYLKELQAANFKKPVMVMSYNEALNKAHDPEFQNFARNSLVVYDEAHRMGQVTSQRSQLPKMIRGKKNLLLTGTPIRNNPEEVAPLVNAVAPGSLPDTPEEFKKKFIESREVPVGLWGKIIGAKPGMKKVPVNLPEFAKAVKGKVDFFTSTDRSAYPSHEEKIINVPMSDKQQATYDFVMGRYPTLAYKIKHGLPMSRAEQDNFQSFMIGPRQVANHPGSFNSSSTDADAPKVQAMVDHVEKRFKADKNFRGVVYSNFIDSGISPVGRELQRRGIPFKSFTGAISDNERRQTVDDYNSGRLPVLLLSGAGAEGLDLKGTKLMQIMEPHWNEELIDQVRGRAIRYKSHAHLPENERHVEVQRFHSIPRLSMWDKVMGRQRSAAHSADEYMYNLANEKRQLNNAFLDAMRGKKTASVLLPLTGPSDPVDLAEFPS
jgi:SNF2 family DNA or RNA helicase